MLTILYFDVSVTCVRDAVLTITVQQKHKIYNIAVSVLLDLFTIGSRISQDISIKADQLDSLKKFCILSENVIFHE